MVDFIEDAQSKQIDQQEHNHDAGAKRSVIRAQDPNTGAWVNIAAVDNGDGTFSLSTSGSGGGSGVDPVGLKDIDDTPINPATEEKQDAIIAALGGSGSTTARYDYDAGTTIYEGEASVGTSEGSTGWTITKYDLTDSNNSSGKVATDVSWTNRTMGTYE